MLLALLLAALPPAPDVLVTGKRLERLHQLCRQGRCTPLRDAQASIAWAEAQFRDGKYVAAKQVLRDAAARNKRHAATHPKPVAAIYEAYATVSWQEGDQDAYRTATAARVRTLKDNLPADDVHVRGAALAIGDMWLRIGQPLEAQRAFQQAERDALAGSRDDVALRARLARARIRHGFGDRRGAAALLASAAALPGAAEPRNQGAIRATRLRFGAAEGDTAAIARVAAEVGRAGFVQPVLVWSPPYPRTAADLADAARAANRSLATTGGELFAVTGSRASDLDPIQWADIGFSIRPDGRTEDIELVRGSTDRAWATPYLTQIAGRRYTATPGGAGNPGTYRVERFTLRANYETPIGSLIRRRAGPGKLEIVDLTDPAATVTAAR
jgi:tetratricopeptide (TPR) repeat protein